jgi:polyisoprenoid-binding protein YceI
MNIWRLAAALAVTALWQAPAWAQAVAYRIDPGHTETSFMVDRFGFTSILGVFAKSEGEIWLDEAHPEASRVEATVTTDSLWTADATRDRAVRDPVWLAVAANPTMSFKSTHVARTGETTAQVTGDLTIRGVTRPATFTVRLNKIGTSPSSRKRTAGFTITGEVDRKDFGITVAPRLIGDKVAIRIESVAEIEADAAK